MSAELAFALMLSVPFGLLALAAWVGDRLPKGNRPLPRAGSWLKGWW